MTNKKIYIVIAFIILALMLAIQPNVYAAETKTLKAQKLREGIGNVTPYAYQLNQKDVWKIYEAPNDYSQAIYCLEAGIGNLWSGNAQGVTYDTAQNMKQSSNSLQSAMLTNLGQNPTEKLNQDAGYKAEDLLKATNNNGSILWLLDNFYLPKHPNATERQAMRNNLLQAAFQEQISAGTIRLQDIKLTDDDIEVVQQWALWQFTTQNNYDDKYTTNILPEMYIATGQNDASLGEYSPLSDLGRLVEETDPTFMIGEYRQEDAQTLFNYLVTTAKANANYTGIENQITLAFANITGQFNETTVGPFKLTSTDKNKLTDLDITIKDQNDKTISTTNYTIVTAAGQTLAVDANIVDKEFYVKLNDPNGEITAVTVEVIGEYLTTTTTKWMHTTSEVDEQDVVIIEKTRAPLTDTKTIEKGEEPAPEFDLSLRKFITNINGEEVTARIPSVNVTPLKQGTARDAIYTHPKTPVLLKTGDIVTYTIRVYNEGQVDGYAQSIMDLDLPGELDFIEDNEINKQYRWEGSTVTGSNRGYEMLFTDYLSKEQEKNAGDNLIKAFNPDTDTQLSYKDVKIVFKVIAPNEQTTTITNIAEIADDANGNGEDVTDRDSTPNNVKDEITNEDDTDVEHIILQYIPKLDLHLRKFITDINGKEVTDRVPTVDITPLKQGTSTDAIYSHPKTPVSVKTGDIVTYTIRIYNEGQIDGYAEIVMDDIPEGLEFLRDNETNQEYRWILQDGLKRVTTDYLSKVQEDEDNQGENLIKGFNPQTDDKLDYKDIKIVFKVIEEDYERTIITNTAEITNDADEDGKDVEDTDSVPNNAVIGDKTTYEDDTDEEHLILQHFDLSLTKHLASVNELNIIGREPIVVVKADGTIEFDETAKENPVEVEQGDIVVYAIRVYNEGLVDGYAKEITDDVPEGLEFIDDPEIIDINKHYRWELSEDGKTVTTDYLSKEQEENLGDNLLKAFDRNTMETPDYKEVLIAFKVLPSEEKGKTIINTAEISDDSDADGNEVEDVDSIPGNLEEDEDDIDTEEIYVKYFDLSLLKWVSRIIITDNGETKTIETGHNGSENSEPPAKVDINRWRINKVDLRFVFEIKVTNEGEIAGYAKEVKDYVPEGLEFVQEDNPKWTINGDEVTTTQLVDTLLKPGESAVISITLRWKNSPDNMGEMVNSAEISEDYNESGTEDIDSTPDNNIPEEDDQDPAPVLISIVTGNMTIYYTLIATSVVILGVGLILIKKYVI